jgi:hypothetical protein
LLAPYGRGPTAAQQIQARVPGIVAGYGSVPPRHEQNQDAGVVWLELGVAVAHCGRFSSKVAAGNSGPVASHAP